MERDTFLFWENRADTSVLQGDDSVLWHGVFGFGNKCCEFQNGNQAFQHGAPALLQTPLALHGGGLFLTPLVCRNITPAERICTLKAIYFSL